VTVFSLALPPVLCHVLSAATTAEPAVPTVPTVLPAATSGLGFPAEWLLTADNLRAVVDKHMDAAAASPASETGKVPEGAIAVLKHVVGLMPKLKAGTNEHDTGPLNEQKSRWYRHCFPRGTQHIVIPRQSLDASPSPHYNAIVGTRVFIIRWELNAPALALNCPEPGCCGVLGRHRMNFSHHGTVVPLVNLGKVDAVAAMTYKCSSCANTCSGVDGRLLHSLPADDRSSYDVDPRLAKGEIHFSKLLSAVMEREMVTDGSAEGLVRKVLSSQTQHWVDGAHEYVATHRRLKTAAAEDWPSFEEYTGTVAPAPALFLDRYADMKTSTLTFDGQSDDLRNTIAIQNVGCALSFAEDHTHTFARSYASGGATAGWDITTSTGHVAAVVCTRGTSQEQYAHAAEQFMKRANVSPSTKYSDIYPNGRRFWDELWPDLDQRLGNFHYIKRITVSFFCMIRCCFVVLSPWFVATNRRFLFVLYMYFQGTFNKEHPDYYSACADVSAAIWDVSREDEIKIETALKAGTMNGRRHSEDEILQLKKSPVWRRRYGKFIRRWVKTKVEVDDALCKIWIRYKVTASPGEEPGQGRLHNGRSLFGPDSRDAFDKAKENSGHIQDNLLRELMYKDLNQSSRSQHGVVVRESQRAEPKAEGYHDLLRSFAREGMREGIADSVHLQGTALYNAGIDCKHRVGALAPSDIAKIPAHLRRTPLRHDELEKKCVNDSLSSIGCSRVFHDVKELQGDNGERFFMQYFHQQKERSKFRVDDGTESKRCQCSSCAGGESVAAASSPAAPAPALASVPALPVANPMAILQLQCFMAIQAAQTQQK